MKFWKILLLSALTSAPAWAGMPVDDSMICPVGGETFQVTGTASCSTMGRFLSMQPVTSCDFITRLPICPTNRLPVYKDFSETDITELMMLINDPDIKSAAAVSPYFAAYKIEEKLSSQEDFTSFILLQQGLWYQPAATFDNTDYLTAYHDTVKRIIALDDVKGKAFWLGSEAFLYIRKNHLEQARLNIEKMKAENADSNDYLTSYIAALEYCLNPSDTTLCQPQNTIRDHKDKAVKKD